jgi:hypothetical protein
METKKVIIVGMIMVALLCVSAFLTYATSSQDVIFEYFDPMVNPWTPVEGTWEIHLDDTAPSPPNVYVGTRVGTAVGSTLMNVSGSENWMNYTVEAMVKLNSGGCSEAFIAAYAQDANNLFILGVGGFGYAADIEIRQHGTFWLLKGVGSRSELSLGKWYQITGQVSTLADGSVNLKLWLDGVFKCEYTLSSLGGGTFPTHGKVGLLIYNGQVYFDNFIVTLGKLSPPPTIDSWNKSVVVEPVLPTKDSIETDIRTSGSFTVNSANQVTVVLKNVGASTLNGTLTILILKDGARYQELESSPSVAIAPGETWSQTYAFTPNSAGTYTINVQYIH